MDADANAHRHPSLRQKRTAIPVPVMAAMLRLQRAIDWNRRPFTEVSLSCNWYRLGLSIVVYSF